MKPREQQRIRRVLHRLADGWCLDPIGKDGLGGLLWQKGETREVIPVATMNYLFSEMLIEHGEFCYVISKLGREYIKEPT